MIHARLVNNVWRFRIWSNICNAYITEEMTAKRIEKELLPQYTGHEVSSGYAKKSIAQRIDRAKRRGTSSMIPGDKRDVHGPWATESCGTCGWIHHEFEAKSDDSQHCASCGENVRVVWHGSECKRSRR